MWMADVEYGTADDRGGLLYIKKVCVCVGGGIFIGISVMTLIGGKMNLNTSIFSYIFQPET